MAGNSIDPREICALDDAEALPPLPPHLAAGALVVARGARWRVDACVDRHDCRELHLRAAAGVDRRVLLWPFDRPTAVGAARHPRVLPLRRWAARAAGTLAGDVEPLAPRAAFTGEILPYQLGPALAMASGVPRVLLADEVGLGKTIQAGWILGDLLAREPDARALIAVPAGLRDQWAAELTAFFALSPARVDAAWLRAAVADRPADVSPWAAPGAYLGSIDFFKRPDIVTTITSEIWDLVVVDEAHTAAAPTERHAALKAITARARRVVIITATPFSGDAAGFSSMASLGAAPGDPPPLMFRRSREEVGDGRTRRHRFAAVRIAPAEYRLQRLLERYSRQVWREAPAVADGARLAVTILRKRALSSPAALSRSLARRLHLLRSTTPAPAQLSLFDEEPEADDVLPDAALATPGLADADREERWLTGLLDAAALADAADSKKRVLRRLLARATGESVVVFTEYRDTLRRLAAALPDALHLHGGMTSSERTAVQRRFNESGGILLATDAAADGLNLQQRCRLVINYELPWNPARLEQRIGRVDRIGQRRRVHAITLVARDTAEDFVVAKLARRLARVAATLGERDRLAALLTEARTARAVIAGSALEDVLDIEDVVGPVAPVARATIDDFPASRVASHLANRRRNLPAAPQPAIARLRAARGLSPGWIAVLRATLVTDRGVVAERPFIFHLAAESVAKPATHRAARAAARMPIARIETAASSAACVLEWRDAASAVHETAMRRRIAREDALGAGGSRGGGAVQPGLFDARALRQASGLAEHDARRRRDHEQHARALEDACRPRLECAVEALLLLWR